MQHVTALSVRHPLPWEHAQSTPEAESSMTLIRLHHHVPGQEWLPSFLSAAKKVTSWLHLWSWNGKGHPGQVGDWVWALASQPGPPRSQPGSLSPVTHALQHHPVAAPLDQSLALLFPGKISKPRSIFLGWPWPFYPQSPPINPRVHNNVACDVPYTSFFMCLPMFKKWNKDEKSIKWETGDLDILWYEVMTSWTL